jgi:Short C-terminal domain
MLTRTYKAKTQAEAAKATAAAGAPPGYTLAGQSWAMGGRSCAASGFIVVGILLLIVGLVAPPLWLLAIICLVIGLVSGGRQGELTVTWMPVPTAIAAAAPEEPAVRPASDPHETLAALKQMLDSGLLTPEEYEAKKAEVLGRI